MTPKELTRAISSKIHLAIAAHGPAATDHERDLIIEGATWEILTLCAKHLAILSAWRDAK